MRLPTVCLAHVELDFNSLLHFAHESCSFDDTSMDTSGPLFLNGFRDYTYPSVATDGDVLSISNFYLSQVQILRLMHNLHLMLRAMAVKAAGFVTDSSNCRHCQDFMLAHP